MANKVIETQIRVEVVLDIYCTKEELKQRAIDAALNCVLESPVYGANFTVVPKESKLI